MATRPGRELTVRPRIRVLRRGEVLLGPGKADILEAILRGCLAVLRAGLVLALLAAAPLRGAELLVHAAASLRDVLAELAATHQKRTGDRVRLSLGASNVLARQLRAGAPGDLFVPADEASLDSVERAGLLQPGSHRRLLSNMLVVVLAADSPLELTSPAGLLEPRFAAIAVAEPRSVPAGIYARQALTALGIWERLVPKLLPTDNARAALAAVEAGNADAGLVYRTDAARGRRVRVALELPQRPGASISYPAAVLRETGSPAAARRLLDFLASDEAMAVFERHGFLDARERLHHQSNGKVERPHGTEPR